MDPIAKYEEGLGSAQARFEHALDRHDYAAARKAVADGADVDKEQWPGYCGLMRRAVDGDERGVRELLKMGAHPDGAKGGLAPGLRARTPLMAAVAHGEPRTMGVLLMAGADVDAAGPDGRTALMVAVENGLAHMACILIENGASVEAPSDGKLPPPVATAVLRNDFESLMWLLGAGAAVGWKDADGATLASLAARSTTGRCMEQLLRAGADFEAADKDGLTPAAWSAKSGSLKCLMALSEAGADLRAKDAQGRSALDWAADEGHAACAGFLRPRLAELERRDLEWAAASGEASGKRLRV